MRKILRPRNVFFALVTLLILSFVGLEVEFAYRTNNICESGDRILQSEADAIKQAKMRFNRARYGSHGLREYFDEKPELVDWAEPDGCCTVTRTRNAQGIIAWEVYHSWNDKWRSNGKGR